MNMNTVIIFSARYLYLVELAIAAVYFLVQTKSRQASVALLSVIVLPVTYLLGKAASWVYSDPRPFVDGHFAPLIAHAADNGFPSDHMLLGSAVAAILFAYDKRVGVAAWAVAFAVGASRVVAGIHHWVDIAGSAAIAIVVTWVVKTYVMPRLGKMAFFGRVLPNV